VVQRIEVTSENPFAPAFPVGSAISDDPVQIREIIGLQPVKASMGSSVLATGRGEHFQGSSVGNRNIVLTLGLNPDWEDQTVASLRLLLQGYFMPEQWLKLRFFTDDYPVVDIEGIVESFEPNLFAQDPEIQISILCHQPDFVEPDIVVIKGIVPNSLTDGDPIEYVIDYQGTVSTGFELFVTATEFKPTYNDRLIVVNQGPVKYEFMNVDPVSLDADWRYNLTTIKTDRRVETVDTDGVRNNLLKNMLQPSTWPEFKPGENIFSVGATESGLAWELRYSNRFGGL